MEINNEHQWKAAEIELTYKSTVKPSLRPKITNSQDVAEVFRQSWNLLTMDLFEEFKILFLNRANRVLGIHTASKGGMCGTVADPKLIFVAALKVGACGIVVSHNHPSGNLTPSQSDIDLTRKLKEAGKFLEIQLLDHVILTSDKYYSFADEGLI